MSDNYQCEHGYGLMRNCAVCLHARVTELEIALSSAHQRADHWTEEAANYLRERDEAREAARACYAGLDDFNVIENVVERWPWLEETT